MWQVLKASWEFKETRVRILYTVLFLVIFRAGTFLPIPGVNPEAINVLQEQAGFLGILNFFTEDHLTTPYPYSPWRIALH